MTTDFDITCWEIHGTRGSSCFFSLFVLQWDETTGIPTSPRMSALQQGLQWAKAHPGRLGPGPPADSLIAIPPTDDMVHYWKLAQGVHHPVLQHPRLEPGLLQVLHRIQSFPGDLARFRSEVIIDIQNLVQERQELTTTWWEGLPYHVASVYHNRTDGYIIQIPIFLELLDGCGYPSMRDLSSDLHMGFDIVGPQHPGPGWLPRTDGRYSSPLDLDTFTKVNSSYLLHRLRHPYVDQHWQTMLDELIQDRNNGKLVGPLRAPDNWPVSTVGIQGEPLQELPCEVLGASICFAVVQSDKIRRCEDFRRSHHNATIQAWDSPHHHCIGEYASLAAWNIKQGSKGVGLWAHDLDAAYRQLPIRDVRYAFVVLQTPKGVTLWQHQALGFGATASVWGFNRMADSMLYLARQLTLIPCLHFVDDFGGIEDMATAHNSFQCFDQMFASLGLRMKQKKAAPPADYQKMLGVFVRLGQHHIELHPCPQRLEKIRGIIDTALVSNQLSPDVAHRLAGKIIFLQTTSFGQIGKAALQCVYGRAAATGAQAHEALTHSLRASLLTLQHLLMKTEPYTIPAGLPAMSSNLFTDAFFELGDSKFYPSSTDIPTKWSFEKALKSRNGWGFVFTLNGSTYFDHGSVPRYVIRHFCARRAFIYFLEAVAPLIVIAAFHLTPPKFLVIYVDNQAALQALIKGYGRDGTINGLLSFFWSLVARLHIYVHFTWVPSEKNISDPVSRGSFELATEMNWTRIHLDLEPFYHILVKSANDIQYATSQAVEDCLKLHFGLGRDGVQ